MSVFAKSRRKRQICVYSWNNSTSI